MKRRTMLRGFGLLALAPMLAIGDEALDPGGLWRDAVAYAKWSPSPHNIQPWRLRLLSPVSGELYCDPACFLPNTDPTSAFTLIGLAIFAEYLAIAFRPLGYSLQVEYQQRPLDYAATSPLLVARLRLERDGGMDHYDRQLVLDRRTSRLPYDGTPAGDEDMAALAAQARGFGQHFAWSSDEALVRAVLELNRDTVFADLDDDLARNELRPWIRCTDKEAEQTRTGLWSQCLQFPGWLLKAFFDNHDKWAKGWRRHMCGNMLVNGMHGTRTVAWWQGPFAGPDDWLRCGTLLARNWLELTRRGLSLHPFGSVITNSRARASLRDMLGISEGSDQVWLLVRLGRSEQAPRSYRLGDRQVFI